MNLNIDFVSAGAGSGKTYTITQKMNNLLAKGEIQPRGVIATTFTRLAAGELRERVRESLMKSGKIALANQMGQAAINTVNGVCGDLLKRFSFEAGLSPEQTVLDENEAARLFKESIDLVLDENVSKIRALNALSIRLGIVDRQGRVEWKKQVQEVTDKARANNCSTQSIRESAARSSESLLAYFRKPTERDLDAELLQAITKFIAEVDFEDDKTKGTSKYTRYLHSSLKLLKERRLTWSDWVKLSKEKPTKKSLGLAEAIMHIAEDVECHPRLHDDITKYCALVFDVAAESIDAYQSLKRQKGLVDFTDQEIQLYHLLENPQVKETLADELQLFMVDEFQDTSPIQLALFMRLAELANNVIWVGDIKQAIYGFRGSDPALMTAVLDAAIAQGTEPEVLEKSWRSRPALVNYCNDIFVDAFSDSLDRSHVELISARHEMTDGEAVIHWNLDGSTVEKRMAAIPTGIISLVESGYEIVDKESEQLRPIRFGDVAVLCRSNARLATLAGACAEAGLTVGFKRAGLLATAEGKLGMAALRRLADPQDTLATAEIRTLTSGHSPEVWLEERLNFVASDEPNSKWGETEASAFAPIIDLANARKSLPSLTPSEAIKLSLSAVDARAVVNSWGPTAARSRERLANLDCLVSLAGEYENHCDVRHIPATVPGLILWLNGLAEREEDWQAIGQGADTVTLLTYHGSKGLEWPVVVAVDLESKLKTRLWGLSVDAGAEPFDVKDPLANRELRLWPFPFGGQSANIPVVTTLETSEIGLLSRAKAIEEEKRLLYVTLTRPRDLLILAGKEGNTGYEALLPLDSPWMIPRGKLLSLPCGMDIPSAEKTVQAADDAAEQPAHKPHWLPEASKAVSSKARRVSPSSLPAIDGAKIGDISELGERINLSNAPDMASLGTALHGVIAASANSSNPLDVEHVRELLSVFDVDGCVSAEDALAVSQRLIDYIRETVDVQRIFVEYPISAINNYGQEIQGFIDMAVETADGWIIIDHKSTPSGRKDWEANSLKYSGQLQSYRHALEQATSKAVVGLWVHFPVTGALVELELGSLAAAV